MKKILLIAATIWGLTTRLHAKAISYGPKAGVNFSFIGNLDKLQPKKSSAAVSVFDVARTAFHWGAYGEYVLNKQFSIGAELVYTYVGSVYKNQGLQLSYISIPAWCMYHPFGMQQGFSAYLGPALNALWHATPKNLLIIKEQYIAPFEWAIVGGLRYLLDFGLSIDLRYNWGLTGIFDFHPDPAGLRPAPLKGIKLTNHCLQLSLGYNLAPVIQDMLSPAEKLQPIGGY